MRTRIALLFTLLFVASLGSFSPLQAQYVRWDPPSDAAAITTQGVGLPFLVGIPNVAVQWCTYPANAVPCTNLAQTYNGISGAACTSNTQITLPTSSTCQLTSDNFGNWGVYVPAGTYSYTMTVGSSSYGPFTASVGASSSGSQITFETNGNQNASQVLLNLLDSGNGQGSGYAYIHVIEGTPGNVNFNLIGPGFAGQLIYDNGTGLTNASGTSWNNGTQTLTLPNITISGTCIGCSTASVASVGGTTSQICVGGTPTNPIIAICSPFSFPGNFFAAQASNGNTLGTFTRNTDSSPTGNFFLFRSAGLATLGSIDIFGNATFPSYTTNGSGAGYQALAAGTDNSANCLSALSALSLTGICIQAPTGPITSWSETMESAGPAVASLETFTALSGTSTVRSFTALSGTGFTNVATGAASLAGAANNILLAADGGGNIKSSGVASSSITQNCNAGSITFAVLCGHVDFTGVSASLPCTGSTCNILTVSGAQAGQYVIAVYMNATATTCSSGGSFAAKIAYTDSNGSVTKTVVSLNPLPTALPGNTTGVVSFWLTSSATTLNVAGTYVACTGGSATLDLHYSLYRVE